MPAKEATPSSLQELCLDETVAGSVEKLKGSLLQNGITVMNQIPAGLPALWVEREKFQRLFDLLLKDEIISLPPEATSSSTHALGPGEEQEVEIELRDDGPGLPREALRSLFDPLSLRMGNDHEFGINLMACYFIIYHHGGKIDVQNQEGQGVTFTLTFPVRPKMASPAEEEEAFITKVLMNDAFWERLVANETQ